MPEPSAAPTVTLLLVDPDTAGRRIVVPRLDRSCGRVIEVESAELALYALAEHAVDLVVASAHLAGMGAEGLCRELREREGPPAVAYRIGVSPDAHIRWFDAGGADCLSGDDPVLLAARCRAALRRHRVPFSPWHHHVG